MLFTTAANDTAAHYNVAVYQHKTASGHTAAHTLTDVPLVAGANGGIVGNSGTFPSGSTKWTKMYEQTSNDYNSTTNASDNISSD